MHVANCVTVLKWRVWVNSDYLFCHLAPICVSLFEDITLITTNSYQQLGEIGEKSHSDFEISALYVDLHMHIIKIFQHYHKIQIIKLK